MLDLATRVRNPAILFFIPGFVVGSLLNIVHTFAPLLLLALSLNRFFHHSGFPYKWQRIPDQAALSTFLRASLSALCFTPLSAAPSRLPASSGQFRRADSWLRCASE